MLSLSIATASLTLLAQIFSSQTSYAQNSSFMTETQDKEKAIQFFQDQLNFTTNPYGVKKVIDGKASNITIVDVRGRKDFEAGHIPGAVNVPFDEYNGFTGDERDFPGLNREGMNYVYCASLLCNLSEMACLKFASAGYDVKEIKGGFKSWKEHSYPVATGQ